MTRRLAMAIAAAVALGLAAVSLAIRPEPAKDKPELMVLTSLPLLFPEKFGLGPPAGAPVAARLERDFRLVPIAAAEARLLDHRPLLLMVQPRAQPAELLVALDEWVRRGGRVLLLADPRLEWDSDKPLGDLTRPPATFSDTGLLVHWGVRLDSPDGGQAGSWSGQAIESGSAGRLVPVSPGCAAEPGGLVARCRIGRGMAVIVADADVIDPRRSGGEAHADLLVTELKALATQR